MEEDDDDDDDDDDDKKPTFKIKFRSFSPYITRDCSSVSTQSRLKAMEVMTLFF